MIFEIPTLQDEDLLVLALILEQKNNLRFQINQNPQRWTGFLRRSTFARAVQGSNSIEGYNAGLADAVEIIDDERPETVEEESRRALVGYRYALTYIVRIHDDPYTTVNTELIRSLHFMMLSYDLTKAPGQWRSGPIYVVREETGEQVYEGPDSMAVPGLMDELVQQMNLLGGLDAMVRGAMAHLNLTMI